MVSRRSTRVFCLSVMCSRKRARSELILWKSVCVGWEEGSRDASWRRELGVGEARASRYLVRAYKGMWRREDDNYISKNIRIKINNNSNNNKIYYKRE